MSGASAWRCWELRWVFVCWCAVCALGCRYVVRAQTLLLGVLPLSFARSGWGAIALNRRGSKVLLCATCGATGVSNMPM